jgi:hypothetical protein
MKENGHVTGLGTMLGAFLTGGDRKDVFFYQVHMF